MESGHGGAAVSTRRPDHPGPRGHGAGEGSHARTMSTVARRQTTARGPVLTESLADLAYRELKARVICCELEPGRLVTEASVVRQLGIGKTPVREALARLVQDGLVRAIPRHGYEITPITLGDVQELFGLRLVVEPAAVQLAAGQVHAATLRRLDELCQAAYHPGDHDSITDFLRINHEFHSTIANASGNRRLAQVVVRVLDESERLFHLSMMLLDRGAQMVHEHRELVDALVAGEAEAARRITVEQILSVQRMVVDALLLSPAVLSAPVAVPHATVSTA